MSLIGTYNLTQPFELLVSQGQIPGHSIIDKFGELPTIDSNSDPADIWEGGSISGAEIYTFTADAGANYYASSSNNSDTQNISFRMLTTDVNGNWYDETFTQAIAGQTKTQLLPPSGRTPVRFIRMENEADFGDDLVGVLYVYEDTTTTTPGVPDDVTKIRGIINNGNNQTLMAIFTIPTGKVGFLYRGEAGISKSGGVSAEARMSYRSRRFGKIFKIKKKIAAGTQGTSSYQDKRSFPDVIPAKTDIVLRADEVSAEIGVFGTFDILLIDEDKFSDAYLNAIGQIRKVL